MIENVVGAFAFPLGIATNFRVNGKEILVPMAIEEPSVVAAASNSAKVARATGGFRASTTPPVMIGQIQVLDVADPSAGRHRILDARERLLGAANARDPMLVKFGGGAGTSKSASSRRPGAPCSSSTSWSTPATRAA